MGISILEKECPEGLLHNLQEGNCRCGGYGYAAHLPGFNFV